MVADRCVRIAVLGGLTALLAGPALADVKAGVDAWSRGDFAAAVEEWNTPANQGDADALFNLGQAYKLGRGVPKDIARAEVLFGKAAGKGHQQASDSYGLLLFQRGERVKALPYLTASADRGDLRAQYILGIAHFNGDGVPKDWVRAYALITQARQAGLPQAATAIGQMDLHIPLGERQKGISLAQQQAARVAASRSAQSAAADLGGSVPLIVSAPGIAAPAATPAEIAGAAARPAGANQARPRVTGVFAAPTPARAAAETPHPAAQPAAAGPWKLQLGAFGVPGNAEALWQRVKARSEITGRTRLLVPTGKVTRLLAGGYPTRAAAQTACARLSAAGFGCLAVAH